MKQIKKILYQEVEPYTGYLLLLLFLIFLGVGMESISPWSFKLLIDNVLGGEPIETGTAMAKILSFLSSREALGFFAVFVYFASTMTYSLMDYFIGVTSKKLNRRIIAAFSQKAFDSLEQLSSSFYKKQQIGDYIYRLSYDVSALGELLEEGLLPLVTNFLFLILTIGILFYINAQLAVLSLTLLPVLALSMWIFNRSINQTTEASERSNSTLFSFIQEVLSQLRIVQSFNKQKRESALFQEKETTSLTEELNMHGFNFLIDLVIGLIVAVSYSIILLYGMRLVFSNQMTTGLLIAFILYLDNLSQPLLSFINGVTTTKENYVKISRMKDFFEPRFKEHDSGHLSLQRPPHIIFDRVTVSLGRNQVIVRDLSFEFPAGKKTVVVGVNGSGKTTVTNLILGFLRPSKGKIMLDGQDLTRYDLAHLREDIAYVPQEVVLFDDTIYNNIAFGKGITDLKEIKAAAELADASGFITHLPKQYQFGVGEDGLNLSGGQRQRIMLARAFLRTKAKILILDEPLSALDVKTRSIVMNNLNAFAQGKTTIFVSNVLEIINQADHIIVLNEGRVLHVGSAKDLFKEKKLADLFLESN